MKLGHLRQKASPYLVMFVLGCGIVVTGLLIVLQEAETLRDNFSRDSFIDYLK